MDRHFAVEVFDPAAGEFDVLLAECAIDIEHRDASGGHAFGVEPEAHGEAFFASDDDRGDAGDGLEAVLDLSFGERGEFEGGVAFAVEGDPEDGLGIRLLFGDDGFEDIVGELAPDAGDAVTDILGGEVDIAGEVEFYRDIADLFAAGAGEGFDAFDIIDGFLEAFRDFGFHDLGIGAGVDSGDVDDWGVDIGEFADGEAAEADDSEQDEREAHHGREHGPTDADIWEHHGGALLLVGGGFFGAGDLDGHARADFLVTFDDDEVTGLESGGDFDVAGEVLAERDGLEADRLVGIDDEDESGVAVVDDGCFGDDEGVIAGLEAELDVGDHARLESSIGVGDAGLDEGGSGCEVEAWGDEVDFAFEVFAGVRGDLEVDLLAQRGLAEEAFRHIHFDFDGVEVDEPGDGSIARDDLAGADAAGTGASFEGGIDVGVAELAFTEFYRGFGDFERGGGLVEFLLGDELFRVELLVSGVGGLGEFEAGFGVGEFGLEFGFVEADQGLVFLDQCTFLEEDVLHDAVGFRFDFDFFVGGDGADEGDGLNDRLLCGGDRHDGHGGCAPGVWGRLLRGGGVLASRGQE